MAPGVLAYSFEFLHAHKFVDESEGGTNTHPLDRGGLTKYGISIKTYPDLDIANLTWEQAQQIYYRDYWLAMSCDKFSAALATILYDSGINCGQRKAAYWLQLSINWNLRVPKLEAVDGIIGSKTVGAARDYDPYQLGGRIISFRIDHYWKLVKKYPEQKVFINGWSDRACRLLRYI